MTDPQTEPAEFVPWTEPAADSTQEAPGEALLHEAQSALRELLEALSVAESALKLEAVPEAHRAGRLNLEHYLHARRTDLRPLQYALAQLGLSSLNSLESHVRPALEAALDVAEVLGGRPWRGPVSPRPRLDDAHRHIHAHATRLFGPPPAERRVRIMVTLDSHHAEEPEAVDALVKAGMDVARINCAKDTPDQWRRMSAHVRSSGRAAGREVRVVADLGGPKVRTVPIRGCTDARLFTGERFRITRSDHPEQKRDKRKGAPPQVGCTLPRALQDVSQGQAVHLDDGKIKGCVVGTTDEWIEVEVTRARERGVKLRPDKGINLPDTHVALPALTERDHRALPHLVELADIVGFSFCQSASDVRDLQRALGELNASELGLIAKIETTAAFRGLPGILAAMLEGPGPCGVMIARGDLSVEIGFERGAEVQEEILWLCEAAHVPVVWATQVLESLAKQGMPSRAEITDAASGARAECVMLNKGRYVLDAVATLDDILQRMAGHQSKKAAMLRPLRSF